MPRNISFSLTTEQIRNKTKIVTRRLGWKFLKPNDVLNACEKCMGLKKNEKVKRICQIVVKTINREPLNHITKDEVELEGFPELSRRDFIDLFCKANKCQPHTIVTRIEFEYLVNFTCYLCIGNKSCEFAFDWYNLNGDCLGLK